MRGRWAVVAAAMIALVLAGASVTGCGPGGGASSGEKKAAEDLQAAKESLEFALNDDEVEEAVGTCLAIAEALSGTPIGDDAYVTAEAAVAGYHDPAYLYADAAPDFSGSEGSLGYGTLQIRALIGFSATVPEAYRDRAAAAVASAAASVGEEWCDRVDDVASDRVSWAKTMRKKGSAGNYDVIQDFESEELAYQRELLDEATGVDATRDAFKLVAGAVAYSQSTEPDAGKTTATARSITSYYDSKTISKAEATGKTLLARSKAAREALEESVAP